MVLEEKAEDHQHYYNKNSAVKESVRLHHLRTMDVCRSQSGPKWWTEQATDRLTLPHQTHSVETKHPCLLAKFQ